MNKNYRLRMKSKDRYKLIRFSKGQIEEGTLTLARFNYHLLKDAKSLHIEGYPGVDGIDTSEKWNKLIDRFIYAFEEILYNYPNSPICIAGEKCLDEHSGTIDFSCPWSLTGMYPPKKGHEDIYKQYVTDEVLVKEKAYRTYLAESLQLFARYFEYLYF